jgi:hypothetical protein
VRVLDRQTLAAQEQRALHSVARREAAQHLGESCHASHSVIGEKGDAT